MDLAQLIDPSRPASPKAQHAVPAGLSGLMPGHPAPAAFTLEVETGTEVRDAGAEAVPQAALVDEDGETDLVSLENTDLPDVTLTGPEQADDVQETIAAAAPGAALVPAPDDRQQGQPVVAEPAGPPAASAAKAGIQTAPAMGVADDSQPAHIAKTADTGSTAAHPAPSDSPKIGQTLTAAAPGSLRQGESPTRGEAKAQLAADAPRATLQPRPEAGAVQPTPIAATATTPPQIAAQPAPQITQASLVAEEIPPGFDDAFGLQAAAPGARSTAAPAGIAAPHLAEQARAQNVAGQIIATIARAEGDRVELRLDPPELGRVLIQLSLRDGEVSAIVTTERGETAELMRRHTDILARELARAGLGGADLSFRSQADQQGSGPGGQANAEHPDDALHPPVRPIQHVALARSLPGDGSLDIRL